MQKRRALLIGVPEYDSDQISNLDIVRQDIEFLHISLEKSGFSVRSLGTDGGTISSQNKIKQEIRKEFSEAKKTDVLLIYFSGHGIHYEGIDYLAPSDANLDNQRYLKEYLIYADLGEIVDLDGCDAKTIIFFIDACREGVQLEWKSLSLASFGRGKLNQISKRRCVLVFACESGQYSQYISGDEGFSLFSKALAEVIDPQYPATTLQQVLTATQIKLNDLVKEHQKKEQKIHYSFESSVDDDTLSRVICEGSTPTVEQEAKADPWTEAALQSSLWQNQETDENCTINQLKQQVARIVAICWQKWQQAIQIFPQDAWRDQQFPLRMLESLELLVFRSDPLIELTEAETALIITVPFIREAVLANGIITAAKANPLSLDEKGIKEGFANALDKLHQSQPRFIRKAKRLQEQGRTKDQDAVMTWLMHYCLLKTIEIWMAESERGYLSDDFINELGNFEQNQPVLVRETLPAKRLLELARCTLVDIERIDRDDRPDPLQNKLTVGKYREEQEIREKMLAYLLKLAGLLAIDIRTLSDVLVDHIGLSDPLNPEDIITTLNQIRWNPIGKGRTLKVICHHPALDLTLRNHVKNIDEILSYILQQIAEKQGIMNVLQGLPTHLLPNGITAEKQNNIPVYQIPHVNFQLAHDEIRELLMGEQLYGDPTLAIRELYQNALDACRYREARLQYLQEIGKYHGEKWEGKIIFRQAKDEQGREYIECEDNGIGMEMQHLSQCFARAGRRFADLPEFIEEQAEWLKCDPPILLYPNSQFGIGVLSYFMLTDEIEVETCRLDHQGKPGKQLQVRIPGSSGLFRIQELGKGKNSGTRIRLYLNRSHYQNNHISCLEILKRLLWVAEFRTEVQEFEQQELWQSAKLRHPELSEEFYINANHPDLWWITEKGRILSDGLVTEETSPCIVVNLCRSRRPKLTVDRKNIIEWDQNWAKGELIKGRESLVNWSSLSMEWLWKLEKSEVYIAEHIVILLIQNNIHVNTRVEINYKKFSQIKIPIAEIGCFFVDQQIEKSLYEREYGNTIYKKVHSHRQTIWQKYKKEHSASSLSPISYPVPLPGDAVALLLTTNLEHEEKELKKHKLTNFVFLVHLIKAGLVLNEPLAKTVTRLRKFSCLGLKLPKIDTNFLSDLRATPEDLILLSINLDGKEPWLEKEVLIGHLVWISIKLHKPITEIYQRLQLFSILGIKLPKIHLESLSNLSLTEEDLILLSEKLDKTSPRIKTKISPIHILKIAHKLNISVAAALRKLQKFIPLGLELPQVQPKLFEQIKVTSQILRVLSQEKNGRISITENFVTLLDILISLDYYEEFEDLIDNEEEDNEYIENYFNEWLLDQVTQITEILNSFVPLGIELEKIDFSCLNSVTLKDLQLLYYYLNGEYGWDENNQPIIHLLEASSILEKSVAEILKSLEKFASLGLKIPKLSPENLESFIVLDEDFDYLSKYEDRSGLSWLEHGFLEPVHIDYDYIKYKWGNMSISNFIKKMQRYIPLGVKVPEVIPDNIRKIDNITNIDKLIFYEDFHVESSHVDKVSLIHILRSAYWLDEPLVKTIERFQIFISVGCAGIEIPENISEYLSSYKVTDDDLKLLFEDFKIEGDYRVTSGNWLQDKVTSLHILQAVVKLNKPVTEIVNSLQQFVPLGLEVPQISIGILEGLIPTKEDMIIFSKNLDSEAPFFKEKIPNWQIVRASFALNETVAETIKRVQRFMPLGVELPETNPDSIGDFTVNYDDLIALSQDLDANEPWLETEVSLNHILRVSMWLKQPVANILTRLQKLSPLGFKIPEINLELLDNLIVTQTDLIVLSDDLDGAEPWIEGEISPFHITCAAQRLNEPITKTLQRFNRFIEILNLKLPSGNSETWSN